MKRFIATLMILCLVVSAIPIVSASGIVASGTCGADGDNLKWTLDSSGVLTISGEGKMDNATPWREYYESIQYVIIEDGVTSICDFAFYNPIEGNDNIVSITIPDSVVSIGYGAFHQCSKITGIHIPEGVSVIEDCTFLGCTGLTDVFLPSTITRIGIQAFSGCGSLVNLSIPESVTVIAPAAFEQCSSLREISIPESVESIESNTFSRCTNLEHIYFWGNGITNIQDWAFADCSSLKEITFPEGVMSVGTEAFFGCSSLSYISIPSTIRKIDSSSFYGCSSLENVAYAGSEACWRYLFGEEDGIFATSNEIMQYAQKDHAWNEGVLSKEVTENEDAEVTYTCGYCDTTRVESLSAEKRDVVSIDVSDLTLVENTNGTYGAEYFHYNYIPEYTVTLSDGSIITSEWGSVEIGGEQLTPTYIDQQSAETPWSVGTYEVTAKLKWATDTFKVTVTDNPVKSISIGQVNLIEGMDGYTSGYWDDATDQWIENAWFCYNISPETITVVYNDGTSATYQVTDIYEETGFYVNITTDQSYENPWGIGTHTAMAEYMGATTQFDVVISKSPVEKIEIIKAPDKTTFLTGEYIDFKGAVLRAYYIDGSYEDLALEWPTVAWNNYIGYQNERFDADYTISLSSECFTEAGKYNVELTYLNSTCTYDVEIVSCIASEISIKSDDKKTLIVTVKNLDGTVYDMEVLGFDIRCGDKTSEYTMSGGYMLTDQGCFYGEFYQSTDGSFYLSIRLGIDNTMLNSNTLNDCDWMNCYSRLDAFIMSVYFGHNTTASYEGVITKENIDNLIEIAIVYGELTEMPLEFEICDGRPVYNGTSLEKRMLEIFDLTEVNLSLSENYNPQTNAYTSNGQGYGRSPYRLPIQIVANGSILEVTVSMNDRESIRILLSDMNKIHAFYAFAPDHTHDYTSEIVTASCTGQGYKHHICTVCGDSYIDTYVDALGHSYENGVCVRCGEKDPNMQPPVEFADVPGNAWYVGAVEYAVRNGLMNGVGDGQFEPEGSMTRAMLVTVLWRYEGAPEAGKNTFSDVPNGQWYTDAVAWAAANGVVNGVGKNRFDPEGKITREQMATILYRYAEKKGIDTSKRAELGAFPDAKQVSTYAKDAVQWAVAEKIINGSDGKLLPQGNATRAQVATILMRFIENIVKK